MQCLARQAQYTHDGTAIILCDQHQAMQDELQWLDIAIITNYQPLMHHHLQWRHARYSINQTQFDHVETLIDNTKRGIMTGEAFQNCIDSFVKTLKPATGPASIKDRLTTQINQSGLETRSG